MLPQLDDTRLEHPGHTLSKPAVFLGCSLLNSLHLCSEGVGGWGTVRVCLFQLLGVLMTMVMMVVGVMVGDDLPVVMARCKLLQEERGMGVLGC